MQHLKKYIRSNRELQKENDILKDHIKTVLHHYCKELVTAEILTHKFRCTCLNENIEQKIKEKEEFFSKLFIQK